MGSCVYIEVVTQKSKRTDWFCSKNPTNQQLGFSRFGDLAESCSFIGILPCLIKIQGCIGFVQCRTLSGDYYIVLDILYSICMSLGGAPKLVGNSQKTVTSLSISGRIIFTFIFIVIVIVTFDYHVTCRN